MFKGRLRWLFTIFLVFYGVVLLRLFGLAIMEGDSLAAKASNQRTHKIDYYQYGRGDFLDTNGVKITGHQSATLVVFPASMEDPDALTEDIAKLTGLSAALIKGKIANAKQQYRQSVVIKNNLTVGEIEALESAQLSGAYVLSLTARYSGNEGIHLLGYLGQGETAGEYMGKSGLELRYNTFLQGRTGPKVAALVDERGRQLPGNGFVLLPGSGEDISHDLVLTLDWDFQLKVENALGNQAGAAVVLDVSNGDILAMASSPQVDPYWLESPASDDAYVNKAVSYYPPASTFKLLLALAALEEGIPVKSDFECIGHYELPNGRIVKCWNEDGHGLENLDLALANSCNAYFIDLGLSMGGEIITEYVRLLDLDQQTITGYALEQTTNFTFSGNYSGDVANVSIGESGVLLSPLQVAQLYACVAGGGKKVQPRLVKEIRNRDGEVTAVFESREPKQIINPYNAALAGEMLDLAVKEGTGFRAGESGIASAGKTGTSQDQGVWFAGYAPADNPRWAVAVYIENGSSGGREGAQVFSEIISSLTILKGDN